VRGYVPFEVIQRLVERKVDFDVIGLQFYYGNVRQTDGWGHPARDALAVSRILDWYRRFNKTVFVTEVSAPSSYLPDENFEQGYWHTLPSEETQSDWLRLFYTIAYSKPYVESVTWWDGSDIDPFTWYGGLLDSQLRPKVAYYTLKDLIHSWTTEGVGVSDSSGVTRFRGFAGEYAIRVEGYEPAEARVSENGSNEITIILRKQVVSGVSNTATYIVAGIILALVGVAFMARRRTRRAEERTQQSVQSIESPQQQSKKLGRTMLKLSSG
jgi:hypothetical protein